MKITIAIALLLTAATVSAQEGGWRLFGSNEILLEDFDVSGDASASPFPFEGTFVTDRLGLNLSWTDGARELTIRADLLGSDSEYLPDDGVIVGALSLRFENGAAAVPYRVEAGDFFADVSRRVLQRQIRGTMVELQPSFGAGTHSVMLLLGSGTPAWRDAFSDGGDLAFSGASWLWQSATQGTTLVASVTNESVRAGAEGAFPIRTADLDQRVASLAARTRLGALDLEAEASFLEGDDDGASYFGEVSRVGGRVQWRARLEDTDREYRPVGAMGVIAGRSTAEAEGRVKLGARSSLHARAQTIDSRPVRDLAEVSIDLAGLTLESRPIASRPGFAVQLMADANWIEADDRSQDLQFENYGFELRDWISSEHDLTWRSWLRRLDDGRNAAASRRSQDHEVLFGRTMAFGAWSGRIGGGIAYRRQRGSGAYRSVSPLAELNLGRGPHRLRFYLGYADQEYFAPGAFDLVYQNRRAVYSFVRGPHEIALEYGEELREPEARLETDSNRIALRYRWAFAREF